jgi:capsular polysaccharide biosynthesis protein
VLLAVLVTGSATAMVVMPRPAEYQSKATFIVRPQVVEAGDEIRAIDTLIRGGSINATYASIARSRLIRERAREDMAPGTPVQGLRAKAEVVTGTNILSITVTSRDPQLAHDFLAAVSVETVDYVAEVDAAYRLEPLDPPSLPSQPVDARKGLTISLGIILGLVLGVGLAMLIEYVKSSDVPREDIDGRTSTVDPPDLVAVTGTNGHTRAHENGTGGDRPDDGGEGSPGEPDDRSVKPAAATLAAKRLEVVDAHSPERIRRAIRDMRSSPR